MFGEVLCLLFLLFSLSGDYNSHMTTRYVLQAVKSDSEDGGAGNQEEAWVPENFTEQRALPRTAQP